MVVGVRFMSGSRVDSVPLRWNLYRSGVESFLATPNKSLDFVFYGYVIGVFLYLCCFFVCDLDLGEQTAFMLIWGYLSATLAIANGRAG